MVIEYLISTHLSKFPAYHSKNQNEGIVKIFISTLWDQTHTIDLFTKELIFFTLLERICLERAFQGIKMKNRCNPCKMEKYAWEMYIL